MAVTIHDTPQDYTPSDNPVTWTFSSDMTAEDNFYFEIGVFINDVLIKEEQIFPESGIYGKYDASAWANNACNAPAISNSLSADAANYAQVKIRVRERYGDPPVDQAEQTTANITVWKARLRDDDFVSFVYTDYTTVGPSIGKQWLTNYPTSENQKVGLQEQVRLMAINNLTDLNITISLYDSSDVLIASDSFIDGAANRITIYDFSPQTIIANTTITSGNFDSAAYYVITEATPRYADYRFDINTDCQYSTYKRLHFLSQIGTIEAFSFNLISRESGAVSSSSYQRSWGEWNGSSFEYAYTQGRDIDFAKTVEKSMVIESDWLFEEIQHWMVENLYASPLVYLEASATELQRRKITNTSWMKKIQENDQLFRELVTLKLPTLNSMTVD